MSDIQQGIETIALHGGQEPDSATNARALPIYLTSSFVFDNVEHAANLFGLKEFGNIYTRIMNPTTDVLEKRLAMLQGGSAALATSSGMSAITLATLALTKAGQNIVSTSYLYGGTYTLFHYTFARFGIEVRFVDSSDPKNIEAAIDDNTRLVYTESIGNPKNNVDDFKEIARIAHSHNIPFIVDNTVSPVIFNPFEHGADVVVYSLTKFIGGHGTSIGGGIIESGKFNWNNGKFPELSEPDSSYHGVNFWELFGDHDKAVVRGIAYILKIRLQLLRDMGPCISPFNSFMFTQGLETLPIRMKEHCKNALQIAKYLESHPAVSWVNYPGLESHPDHANAVRYLNGGFGAIIGFGIKGGLEAGKKFINSVKLLSHLANIGDVKGLVIHPASTTHQQLSPEELLASGVTEDFIRFSVGLETVDDIKNDLDQALKASQA